MPAHVLLYCSVVPSQGMLLLARLSVGQLSVVSGPCTQEAACVQSHHHPDNYEADEYCEITATTGVPLTIEAFSIEPGTASWVSYDTGPPTCNYDSLRIDGVGYCNSNMPPLGNASGTGLVPTSSEIIFSSDDGIQDTGFRICQYTPPAPPQAPLPPTPPPPPASPPGFCSDTCDEASGNGVAGVCNDGADGDPAPVPPLCAFGSDCACASTNKHGERLHLLIAPAPRSPAPRSPSPAPRAQALTVACASFAPRALRLARAATSPSSLSLERR